MPSFRSELVTLRQAHAPIFCTASLVFSAFSRATRTAACSAGDLRCQLRKGANMRWS